VREHLILIPPAARGYTQTESGLYVPQSAITPPKPPKPSRAERQRERRERVRAQGKQRQLALRGKMLADSLSRAKQR